MCQGPVLEVLLSTSPIELNENLIQQISFMVSRLVLNEIEKKKKKKLSNIIMWLSMESETWVWTPKRWNKYALRISPYQRL